MIRVTITGPPIQPILGDLAAIPRRILAATNGAVRKSLDEIRSHSKVSYLSGPRPIKLGVITGNLKRSLQSNVFQGANSVTGRVYSDTPYSKYHEFGFSGRRRIVKTVRGKLRLGRSGQVNYKGRPWLWPAFVDKIPSVTRNIIDALKTA